jgi:hypothetical protein
MIDDLRPKKISFLKIIQELITGNQNNLIDSKTESSIMAASESFCVIGFSKII